MNKNTIIGATVAAFISTSAIAGNATNDQASTVKSENLFTQTAPVTFEAGKNGYYKAANDQIRASTLIGQYVYSGLGEDAETVGDVNDVIMSQDGKARAVLIGVGGFLGISEKNVAVDFEKITWATKNEDGEKTLVISATKKELEDAPAYDPSEVESGAVVDTENKTTNQ